MTRPPEIIWAWMEEDARHWVGRHLSGATMFFRHDFAAAKSDLAAMQAEIDRLTETLRRVEEHDRAAFSGPDADKNKRSSWRGIMRRLRADLKRLKVTPEDAE